MTLVFNKSLSSQCQRDSKWLDHSTLDSQSFMESILYLELSQQVGVVSFRLFLIPLQRLCLEVTLVSKKSLSYKSYEVAKWLDH